jgi:hypothetical protein
MMLSQSINDRLAILDTSTPLADCFLVTQLSDWAETGLGQLVELLKMLSHLK